MAEIIKKGREHNDGTHDDKNKMKQVDKELVKRKKEKSTLKKVNSKDTIIITKGSHDYNVGIHDDKTVMKSDDQELVTRQKEKATLKKVKSKGKIIMSSVDGGTVGQSALETEEKETGNVTTVLKQKRMSFKELVNKRIIKTLVNDKKEEKPSAYSLLLHGLESDWIEEEMASDADFR